jgi:ADP-ribosylation factor GTPase-activating protein 2/3
MKFGGNAAYSAYLNKNGAGGATGRAKYERRVAEVYREELGRKVKVDEARSLEGVVVEGTAGAEGGGEEDFFESWSKPSTPQETSRVGTPVVSVLGRAASAASGLSAVSNGSNGSPITSPAMTPAAAVTPVAPKPRLGLTASKGLSAGSGGSLKLGGRSKKGKLGERFLFVFLHSMLCFPCSGNGYHPWNGDAV